MLKFRNLDVTPDDPVETWGVEGILIALERGGLVHARKVVAAILADPEGETALDFDQVAEILLDAPLVQLVAKRVEQARNPKKAVTRRMQRALGKSGKSLRSFASECGTSASRMSSYVHGTTIPGADVLLRVESAADRSWRENRSLAEAARALR